MEDIALPVTHIRRAVVIDTDLSFDDYVALLYLLQHPDIDIRAITVVNGVAHVRPGIANLQQFLACAGRTDIPIAGGPDKPLAGRQSFPPIWRMWLDLAPRLLLPNAVSSVFGNRRQSIPPGLSAPELICQQCYLSDTPLSLVTLGPLTNLALALRADPALVTRLDTVFVSGGAIHISTIESNLSIDPVAAEIVFSSGVRIALIPKDVTNNLLFSNDFVRRFASAAHGRTSRMMLRVIKWWQVLKPIFKPRYRALPMWDGVVAAIAADPAIGTDWRDLAIRVVTTPEIEAGRTVVDANRPPNVRACLGGDQAAFETAYLTIASAKYEE